jgi:hypothetical protein
MILLVFKGCTFIIGKKFDILIILSEICSLFLWLFSPDNQPLVVLAIFCLFSVRHYLMIFVCLADTRKQIIYMCIHLFLIGFI